MFNCRSLNILLTGVVYDSNFFYIFTLCKLIYLFVDCSLYLFIFFIVSNAFWKLVCITENNWGTKIWGKRSFCTQLSRKFELVWTIYRLHHNIICFLPIKNHKHSWNMWVFTPLKNQRSLFCSFIKLLVICCSPFSC